MYQNSIIHNYIVNFPLEDPSPFSGDLFYAQRLSKIRVLNFSD